MSIKKILARAHLLNRKEMERVRILAYYHAQMTGTKSAKFFCLSIKPYKFDQMPVVILGELGRK